MEIRTIKNISFKEEMLNNIIPRVRSLIDDEKNHLVFLQKNRLKIFEKSHLESIDDMIEKSNNLLDHLIFRLEQYIDYCAKL